MKENLQLPTDKINIPSLLKRYHFSEGDYALIDELVNEIKPLLSPVLYYSLNEKSTQANALLTLGIGIDQLSSKYTSDGILLKSYAIDCIACELLSIAYTQMIDIVEHYSHKFVCHMEFLGSKYPLEMIDDFIKLLKPEEISANSSFMLTPQKTVCLILPLSDTPVNHNKNHSYCLQCQNLDCDMRQT